MKMNKISALISTMLVFGLIGCNTNTNDSISLMKKNTDVQHQATTSVVNKQLQDNLQHELIEIASIQDYINKNQFDEAEGIFNEFHDEFHGITYPALISEKGQTYADDIHSKVDQLEDAINSHDKNKTIQLIKDNADNIRKIAYTLGIQLAN